VVPDWIEFPDPVINGIAQQSDGLKCGGLFGGKYFDDILQAQTPNFLISNDQPWVIPVHKLIFERV
jgi:hypothetical protein